MVKNSQSISGVQRNLKASNMKLVKILIKICDVIMNTILILFILLNSIMIYAIYDDLNYDIYEEIGAGWIWRNEWYRIFHEGPYQYTTMKSISTY